MTEYVNKIRVKRVQEPKVRIRVLPRVPPLEIELQNTGSVVQWRLGTTGTWQDLIEIDAINATVSVGTVTTLPAGQPATVVNVGTEQDVILDFGIPAGAIESVNGQTGVVILDAGDIGVTPTGGISASDVQTALAELDSEKQPIDSDLTAIAALATTTFGRSLLTKTAAEDVRDTLDSAPYVATRTALKALDTTKDTVAILTEAGREGIFVWTAGNYSSQVTADTAEGIYVKATAIASSAGAWVRQYEGLPQGKWFGASPSATDTVNNAAFTAFGSMAASLSMSTLLWLDAGVYQTTSTAYQITNVIFMGPGKIEAGGYAQAARRSFLTADPGDPDFDATKAFDGLGEHTLDQTWAFVGSAVGSTPGATYRTLTAAAREFTVFTFVGGHNTDLATASLGRTGAIEEVHRAYHGGQGDLIQRQIQMEVYSARAGATHFLANPAIAIENGGVSATGAATGAYLQLTEHTLTDNSLAVAAVARVTNFHRDNAGTGLGVVWVHDRPQSSGAQPIDVFYSMTGKSKSGLDATPADFGANKAAIALKSSDRIYFAASATADALGIKWYADTPGTVYLDSNGTLLRSSVAISPVANDGAALGASGTAWADLFLASGGIINWNAGNVTLTHSSNNLALAANGFSVASATAFQPQISVRNNTNDANGPYFMVRKSRGVTNTAVQVNDILGTFMFQGYDSTGTPVLQNGAYLGAVVESVSAGAVLARFDLVAGAVSWSFKTNGDTVTPGDLYRSATKLLGARDTGWAAPTGTTTKTTFATSTVTLPQLAERVKGLIDALTTHGLIGA